MPINSRDKGKVGEREWSKYLREQFGLEDARRGRQYAGHEDAPDVVGGWPGTHAEVKRVEKVSIDKWIEQAVRDAGDYTPYVAHRRNRKPWLITLRVQDLDGFVEAYMKQKDAVRREEGGTMNVDRESVIRQEISDLKERIAVLAGEAVRVAASEPEPKHHKFRLVKTKQENKR